MSVSAPNQGLPPLQGTPRPPTTPPATGKFPDLHSLAVDTHQDLSALASGLARSGASPETVQTLSVMAGRIGDVAKVLGQPGTPPIPNPAHQAEAPQPQPHPTAGPPTSPYAGQPQPQPQPQAGKPAQPSHAQLGAAVAALHNGMVQAAAAKQQQQTP